MKFIIILILLLTASSFNGAQKHPHIAKPNLHAKRDSIFLIDSIRKEYEAGIWMDSFNRATDSSLWANAKLTKGSHVICEQINEKGLPMRFCGIAVSCEDKGFDWGHYFTNGGSCYKYGRYVLYCTIQIDSFKTLTKEFPACNCFESK